MMIVLRLHAPATRDQRRLADQLGVPYTSETTQGELHLLINECSPSEYRYPPATPAQIEFARRLGAEFDESRITSPYAKALIDHEIVTQSQQIMAENPHIKVGAHITFEGEEYRICTIGPIQDQPWRMRLSPTNGGQSRLIYVAELAHPRVQ